MPLINNIKGDTWKLIEDKGIGMNVNDNAFTSETYNHSDVLEAFDSYFSKNQFIESVSEVLY